MSVKRLRAGDPRGVGPYRFLGRLGAGGMGLVCLARDPDGRLAAVKLIHPAIAADQDYRRRFAREVRAATAIRGRFTAAVLAADPDAPQPWYAAEFIDGPTLGEVVRRSGPLPAPALRALAAALAEALAALEAAGLVHRDVKPDNILLAPDGPGLIDFGLAHRDTDSILTRAGTVHGSPGYMAPEQIAGHGATTASDVFALGTVLAYAAQKHGPFGTGPAEAVAYRTRFGEPQVAEVPEEFRGLVLGCLAKEPAARPTPRDLIALWAVRPDELDTLIQVGRDHHAVQPLRDLLFGKVAGIMPALDPWLPSSPAEADLPTLATAPPISLPPGWTVGPLPRRTPWWHQPVGVDRLPNNPLLNIVLAGPIAGTVLGFAGIPASSTATAILLAATALALGFLLGVRRSCMTLLFFSIEAHSVPHFLEAVILVLSAAVIARVGGLRRQPILCLAIAFAASIAALAWVARGTDGLLIYRDAAVAAACGAAVGFLALIGSSKEAVAVDGPYRATGVNR
ncbi:serine/threonine protein kinase [Catenulispora sp. GP43]|uniref:serine/threonine-protein kinase n=1 Tax=Catenulispora sp. GP43 TaxID=3156263 RepID=UPI00351111DC